MRNLSFSLSHKTGISATQDVILEITSHSTQGPRNIQLTDIRADGKKLTSANSGIDSEPNGPVLRATGFCPRMMIICTRRFSFGNISYHALSYAALLTPSLWNNALNKSFQEQLIYEKVRSWDINTLIRCLTLNTKKRYNFIAQSSSWEASQEIRCILWKPGVHYRIHNNPPPVFVLSQINPVHVPLLHFLNIRINIILPSTPRSSKLSPSSSVSHLISVCTYSVPRKCHMPIPCHLAWSKDTNNIVRGWKKVINVNIQCGPNV